MEKHIHQRVEDLHFPIPPNLNMRSGGTEGTVGSFNKRDTDSPQVSSFPINRSQGTPDPGNIRGNIDTLPNDFSMQHSFQLEMAFLEKIDSVFLSCPALM